jgi:hypothetical protein
VNLVEVTLVRKEVEPGWPLIVDSAPLGKRYLVDLDRVKRLTMLNTNTGISIEVRCIWIESPEPSGWMPIMAFGMAEGSTDNATPR